MAGDDVAALQQRLLDMGFDCGRVDGLFGVETELGAARVPAQHRRHGRTAPAARRRSRPSTGSAAPWSAAGRTAMRESEAITRAGPALAGKLVIIDPGHGGPEPGAAPGLMSDGRARLRRGLARSRAGSPPPARRRSSPAARTAPGRPGRGGARPLRQRGAAPTCSSRCTSTRTTARPRAGVATYYYGTDEFGHHSTVGEQLADLVQREICARTDLVDCRTHAEDLGPAAAHPDARRPGRGGLPHQPRRRARLADPAFRDVLAEAIVAAVQRLYLPPEQDADTGVLRIPRCCGSSRSVDDRRAVTRVGRPAPGSSSRAAAPAPPRRPPARTARCAGPAAAAGSGGAAAPS